MASNLAEVRRNTPEDAESAAETFSNHMGREGREREPETYPHGLMEKGVPCLFYEFRALLKDIRNSYNPMSNTSEMGGAVVGVTGRSARARRVGGLEADGLVRDTIEQIIGTRYNEKKLTVFTTNYRDTRRDVKDETLEDRIGVRPRSRLREMCRTVIVEGED